MAVCSAKGVGLTEAVRVTGLPCWPAIDFTSVAVGALTVTLKPQLALSPPESVAVPVTFVVPTRKAEPEAGLATIAPAGSGQLSVAVTMKFAIVDACPGAAVVTMSAGQDITGSGFTIFVTAVDKLLLGSGSGVDEEMVAVLLSGVPPAAEQLIAATRVIVPEPEAPDGNVTV